MCIHLVKQQEVVTYVSPVEVFANMIKTFNRQVLNLIAGSFPSEGLDRLIYRGSYGKDMEFQTEQDCVTLMHMLKGRNVPTQRGYHTQSSG